ncbi:alcohol dehydrogenase [Sphingomonas koreensis]|uniref:alcohol dehydrogenase n=1 Tax=Sphingomonas koreensis TaxID=93064 RepID=A0A430G1Z5_9SPHN|nr:alcohol dehydrogenase [Sphingomonas koreensis]RSY82017.1 alcohol dehydrogenase [Sphingomonas koreensis]
MKAWAVVEAGAPLQEIELPNPEPTGTEVVVEVTHCGVCHSDLHFWKGEYNMGGGKVMRIADRGVTLPRAPGHEIAGRVIAIGPDAQDVAIGDVRVVYPWLGCGHCAACMAEQDNMCTAQRQLGVVQHGGFAAQVVVPHPRYLVDPGGVDLALAATYACSGISVYSALRKVMPLAPDDAVVLIGAGGLGLMGIAMLKAFGHRHIISIDTDADKLAAALAEGATKAIDGRGDDVAARIIEAAGGPVKAVIDFVNISSTARAGLDALAKGGRLVLLGMSGGELTLSLAAMVFRANRVEGSNTGNLQDLRDVIELANSGKLKPTPIHLCPKHEANQAMEDLHHGKVTGRIVLNDD